MRTSIRTFAKAAARLPICVHLRASAVEKLAFVGLHRVARVPRDAGTPRKAIEGDQLCGSGGMAPFAASKMNKSLTSAR